MAARWRSTSQMWWALALLAGALQAASLAWPFSAQSLTDSLGLVRGQPIWWLQTLAMATLVTVLMRSGTARQAAWRGWLFTLAWLSVTFAWLFISMHTYGGLSAVLAVLAVLALAGALAIYYAAACWIFWMLAQKNRVSSAIVFASLWLLAELARGQWLTGFGWGAVGYSQVDGPLQPLVGWIGMYGVSGLAAAIAALLAVVWSAPAVKVKMLAGVLMLGWLMLPLTLPAAKGADWGELSVTLLQGNIAQEEKFEPATGVLKALRWYGEQLQANRSALIITPETALAVLPEQLPDGYWQALQTRFGQGNQAALVGLPLGSYEQGYTNSVVGFKPGQASPWRYDKHHLVPFGEFIPPMFRWFTDLMHIPLGDFSRGALPQPTFDWQGQRIAATVCYENLYSNELATQFSDAAKSPTILVNVSNLGWFGEHLAMDQHLQIARMRALEFDRPFLLATNTGQTAIVNHLGQVTHTALAHTAVALQGVVQGRTGLTPYARWIGQFGLLPLWGVALAVVLVSVLTRRRHLP
ncbi:apolipoprotein N-acyltransferase [Rhodoferax sp.]|uniref:apolipoprotein N-acyltransferase n=1 Tax=Rhodoferax sp. TaxID=50421 RepID=UPI00283F2286|nr:apolipoprotein N-acyltransferase [Rhodoferax sp.]MDR3372080.1 apolipoprotein N-acyltransferase [Rhodoferax sp.]